MAKSAASANLSGETPSKTSLIRSPLHEKLGICQWFHYEDYDAVRRTIALLQDLGVVHLRTGISWADFHRPGGEAWYRWVFDQLKAARINTLVAVWHTPPSLAEGGTCSSPPRRLEDYADFIEQAILLYGSAFEAIELWNEPNNRIKWNFPEYDPHWEKFGAMVREAGIRARRRGKTTVLGGMIPVDHHWLNLMLDYGVLDGIDVVGIHGFPGMWWQHFHNWDWHSHWRGWTAKLGYIRPYARGRQVWITESGFATWDPYAAQTALHTEQTRKLLTCIHADAARVYWYSAIDLDPARACIEMTEDHGRVDWNEYHLGLVTHDGRKKPAYHEMKRILDASGRGETYSSAADARRIISGFSGRSRD